MTSTEQQLLEALGEMELAARWKPAAGPKPNLLELFSKIDRLADQLPNGTDPTLLHYLRRKSYEKARLYLLGKDAENAEGNCHGHSH